MSGRVKVEFYAPSKQEMGARLRLLDTRTEVASIRPTTHPSQDHSVDYCLGRKNRLIGGFFISGARNVL